MDAAGCFRVSAIVLALTIGVTSHDADAVPIVDTTGNQVISTLYPFGETAAATVGQTFTVTGTETQLDSFAFRLDDYAASSAVVDFAAYVYAWDGTKASGSQLFASTKQSSSNNAGAGGWELFSFDTGGVSLAAGQQYVAFLSASLFFDGISSTSTLELSNGYSGGSVVYDRNGAAFGQLTTATWDSVSDGFIGPWDTWFVANFSTPTSVPEPATAALLLTGIAGLAAVRRRRNA